MATNQSMGGIRFRVQSLAQAATNAASAAKASRPSKSMSIHMVF